VNERLPERRDRRRRHRSLTPQTKRTFLETLETGATVTDASRAAGHPRQTFYENRPLDPDFAAAWDDAYHGAGADALIAEAQRRAVAGWDEPVFQRGEEVGVVRRYSDRLLELAIAGKRTSCLTLAPSTRPSGPGTLARDPVAASAGLAPRPSTPDTAPFHDVGREPRCELDAPGLEPRTTRRASARTSSSVTGRPPRARVEPSRPSPTDRHSCWGLQLRGGLPTKASMGARLASLSGWRLVVVLAVLGVASYFAISMVLRLLASLIPLLSIAGAVAVVGWALFAGQHEQKQRN
jgi:hypothetical protein